VRGGAGGTGEVLLAAHDHAPGDLHGLEQGEVHALF